MSESKTRVPLLALATCILFALSVVPASSADSTAVETHHHAPRQLADGTRSERFDLENGLRVAVRHVPRATTAAVILAYDFGHDDDPEGQEGLAQVMAEAAFMSEVGGIGARTRATMDGIRPVGWNIQVERGRVELAELGTLAQFPGVLHQVALRMRDQRPSDASVRAAMQSVASAIETQLNADLANRLYLHAGAVAAGRSEASFERWMSGQGVKGLKPSEVSARVREVFVPVNAVLSLAGNFEGVDLRKFIENEFGGIPAGARVVHAPRKHGEGPRFLTMRRDDIGRTIGVTGVDAPAITDTLHAPFMLNALLIGMRAGVEWGETDPPLKSRFQFSILDDPDCARFYPRIHTQSWPAENVSSQFRLMVEQFIQVPIDPNTMQQLQESVGWLLGGPIPRALKTRATTDPAMIYRLASAQAARVLIADDAFWDDYRSRFDPANPDSRIDRWFPYFMDKARHVGVVYESTAPLEPKN